MEIKFLAVVTALLLLFNFNVCAAGYEYSLLLDDGFISVTNDDDLTQVSEKLKISASDLNSYFNKNGLLYLAVSNDTKTQIRLSAFTDNFSSVANDISYLSDDQLAEFMSAVSENGNTNSEIAVSGGRKYIKVKDTLKDSGGTYTVTQYITICSNQTFYLSCYNEGSDTSPQVQTVFESFLLKSKAEEKPNANHIDILITAGILLFSVLAVIMIISLSKSIFKKQKGE